VAKADDEGVVAARSPLRWRRLREEDPDRYQRLRGRVMLATWAALPVAALGLWLVPGLARVGFGLLVPYLALAAVFLACRTKTLSWWFASWVFAAAAVAAPLVAAVEWLLAGAAGTDLLTPRGGLLAAVVEEFAKLAPLAAVLVLARRRQASFAVSDYLLLGFATGAGVQAVEQGAYQLAVPVLARGAEGLGGWFAVPPSGWDLQAAFPGHHVGTALVVGAVGLAARGRRRLGPVPWLLPALVLAMVTVDHALYNVVLTSTPPGGGGVPPDAPVPNWLVTAWDLWGSGAQQPGLLVVLLVVALVADVRRTRRVWSLLPPVPELGFVSALRRWSNRAAVSLQAWVPARAPRPLRALAVAGAGSLRWLGYAAADLLAEFALLTLAAGRPHGPPGALAGRSPRRRWVHAITALRLRRRLAQRVGRQVERSGVPPAALPSFELASLAMAVLPLCTAAALAVTAAAGLSGGPTGGPTGGRAFVAAALQYVPPWWAELPVWAKLLAPLTLAALLGLAALGLPPAVERRGPVADAEQLLNHPSRGARRYLTERTPGQTAGYFAEYLAARLLPEPRGEGVAQARRELDWMVTDPVSYLRAERSLDERTSAGRPAPPPRERMPRWIAGQLGAGRKVAARVQPGYRVSSVILDRDRKFDAFLPERAMVTRKFSQLGLVKPEIAIGYLAETVAQFTPGDLIVDTPYNRTNFRSLVGTKLRGEIRLEAPVQEAPIPAEVLDAADQLGVVIVDETGRVYNG
jgi:hypothetical protein